MPTFHPNMSHQLKIKREFIKNPVFDGSVAEAIEQTREDGQERLCGTPLYRFIVSPSSTNSRVIVQMVTGIQFFEEED